MPGGAEDSTPQFSGAAYLKASQTCRESGGSLPPNNQWNVLGAFEFLSSKNFHGEPIGFAMGTLAIALVAIGNIAECCLLADLGEKAAGTAKRSHGVDSGPLSGRPYVCGVKLARPRGKLKSGVASDGLEPSPKLKRGRTMAQHSDIFIGLDTSKLKISVAVANGERNGEVRCTGISRRTLGQRGRWSTSWPLEELGFTFATKPGRRATISIAKLSQRAMTASLSRRH